MKLLQDMNKDKLSSEEQLVFLDYLKQCLKNGFSLNASLELLPSIWQAKKEKVNSLGKEIENGKSFSHSLVKIGFSKNIATQLNMALLQGGLIDCLEQLTQLIRLKNKQLKKLRAELAYPALLVVMMIFLLVAMQTFLKTEMESSDLSSDLIFIFLLIIVIGSIGLVGWIIWLLLKQDYYSLKKLAHFPIIGKTILLYVQYLVVYDVSILLSNGFSLQQICELTSKQEKGSLQQVIAQKVEQELKQGRNLDEIIDNEIFLPSGLLLLTKAGADRKEIGSKSVVLGNTLFYELNLKLNRLVVNVQPVCFLFIGACILGMYLKILMPMYSLIQNI